MIFQGQKVSSPIQIIISRIFSGSRDPHNVCTSIVYKPFARRYRLDFFELEIHCETRIRGNLKSALDLIQQLSKTTLIF